MKRSEEMREVANLRNEINWLAEIAICIAELTEATLEAKEISNEHLKMFKKYYCGEGESLHQSQAEIRPIIAKQPDQSVKSIGDKVELCKCGHPLSCHLNESGCVVRIGPTGEYCNCYEKVNIKIDKELVYQISKENGYDPL